MSAQKTRGSRAWKVILGIVLVVVIVLVIIEFGLRWFLGHQMTKGFEEANAEEGITTEEKPEIGFGSTPLLLGLLGGNIPQMTMDTPDTLEIDGEEILGLPEAKVDIREMTVSDNPVAGELTATTYLPDEFLLAALQQGMSEQEDLGDLGDLIVTDMRADGDKETIDVELGGGLATVELLPSAADGVLALEAKRSTLFGIELSQEATQTISAALTESLKNQVPGDLALDDLRVGSGIVEITVVGNDVPIKELSNQFGGEQTGQEAGETT